MTVQRRYCTACQSMKPEETGAWIKTKIKRWACATCLKRMNESPYAKKSTTERQKDEYSRRTV